MISFLTFLPSIFLGTAIVLIAIPWIYQEDHNWLLPVCMGAGIGVGVTSQLSFIWMVVMGKMTPDYFILELVLCLLAGIFAFYRLRASEKIDFNIPKTSQSIPFNPVLRKSFFILIFFTFLWFILRVTYQYPYGKWDAYMTWNMRARVMFRLAEQWFVAFSGGGNWMHTDYPLLIPFTTFRSWSMLGYETFQVPGILGCIFAFSSIFLIYKSVSILKDKNQGYLAALSILATVWFLKHATSQSADVPIAYYLLLTVILLMMRNKFPEYSLSINFIAGISIGCALWTKNEGFLFLVGATIGFLFYIFVRSFGKTQLKEFITFFLGVLPILSVTLFFKIKYAPQNDFVNFHTLNGSFVKITDLYRYFQITTAFLKEILSFGYGILYILGFYYWFLKKYKYSNSSIDIKLAVIILLTIAVGFFGIYIITPVDLQLHLASSLERLLLQLYPSALFLFFLKIPCIDSDKKDKVYISAIDGKTLRSV